MSRDSCIIHVNGTEIEARPGQMLIEVTDAADIYVPRFCYHPKLSIAANCRMCLVEVENAPKPLPACATPVTPGMRVYTKSVKAIGAQRATMEFLLINHPLDCPICDQGGECELQDLAMGFGRDISRYTERKRVVKDKNIGPLVSTDMTRCIHCTRCVRFTSEIAGFQELGTIGRGDRVEISPYIERSIGHELSGNIIDLCPVGALNSKPYRFSARAWELSEHPGVAPHDCLGSRILWHVMDGCVKRVVPQPFDAINETWASDRDRFSYEGIYAPDRLDQPMIRGANGWATATWDEALNAAASALRAGGPRAGALVSPGATVEEGYLLNRLLEGLDSSNLDHRLRRMDFRAQATEPLYPWLGMNIAEVESLESVLVVGSNLRREVPLLAHRIRKAAIGGADIYFANPAHYLHLFPVGEYLDGTPRDFWRELGSLVRAACGEHQSLSPAAAAAVSGSPEPGEGHRRIVDGLRSTRRSALFLGHISLRHPNLGEIEALAGELARLTDSILGYISEGPNAAGLSLAGVLPHRRPGGQPRAMTGLNAAQMLSSPPRVLLLFGIEPEFDCHGGAALRRGVSRPQTTIAFTSFFSESLRESADIVLPLATFAETSGTFVSVEGRWASFQAASRAVGQSRPGWKILRVLGNRIGISNCAYETSESARDELRAAIGEVVPVNSTPQEELLSQTLPEDLSLKDLDLPMYSIDPVLRRASSLQQVDLSQSPASPPAAYRRRA